VTVNGTPIPTGQTVTETSLTGVDFIGGLDAGSDGLYLRAYAGQWSNWTLANATDTGAVTASHQTVAYTQVVALASIFTVSGSGSITGYNVYLNSGNDGEVISGGTPIAVGQTVTEGSLTGLDYVGGTHAGSDVLWLQAVTAQGDSSWVKALITDQSGANDTVWAGSDDNVIYMGGANQTLLDTSSVYADTVVGFSEASGDRIHLTTDTVSDALTHSIQVNGGADTLITLADTSTILLKGIATIDSSFFT
jgi:hypothetical protein